MRLNISLLLGVAVACLGVQLANGMVAIEHTKVPRDKLHSEVAAERSQHRALVAEVALMRREKATGRAQAHSSEIKDLLDTDPKLKQEYPYFHTSAEIRSEVQRLAGACNGSLTMRTLQDSEDSSVSIDVVSVRAKGANPINRIFILFGEHSRELISPESGLYFLRALCGDAELHVLEGASTLLKDNEFKLVLNANPRSRLQVESGNYCLRENPHGVDLNRNWDEKWEGQSKGFDDTDPGPRPFSEPETRIFRDLVTQFEPTVFLTVHSGTRGMYMPWAYDMQHEGSNNREAMMSVLSELDKDHCTCPFGAAGKEVGYPCPGTCLDWVYAKLKTPFVFAFEIYVADGLGESLKNRWRNIMQKRGDMLLQDGHAHLGHMPYRQHFHEYPSDFVQLSHTERHETQTADSCFNMFNPHTEESYEATVKNWAAVYWQMSLSTAQNLKASHSAIQRNSSGQL